MKTDTSLPETRGLGRIWREWPWLAIGAAAACALIGLVTLIVVETGVFDTAATTPHSPLVTWATHTTMVRSVKLRAASVTPPAPFTSLQVQAGTDIYRADCVGCHGGPATSRAPWARGLNPTPPYLLDASRHWSPPELWWIVKHGVKMTGMPGWDKSLSDGQIWDVVAFLEALPSMPPAAFAQSPPSTPAPSGHAATR